MRHCVRTYNSLYYIHQYCLLFKQPIEGHLWATSFQFCPPTTIPFFGMSQVPIWIIFLEEARTGGI